MKDAPKPEKKKGYYLPTILLGIIVAAIFLLAIFTYQVPATERALVLTMGKITKEAEPGLHLRHPELFLRPCPVPRGATGGGHGYGLPAGAGGPAPYRP